MIGETYESSIVDGIKYVLLNMISLTVMLSANLGVMNLLPIPALDGGRLVFLIVELIRRKPIDREKEGFVHLIGFAILMILMIALFYNDIMKLIR
jgi:regulator of sigma E protease